VGGFAAHAFNRGMNIAATERSPFERVGGNRGAAEAHPYKFGNGGLVSAFTSRSTNDV
jgi:hypothetical protein